jgi:ABC-2 family transporter protein
MRFLRQALLIARRDVALILLRREGIVWVFVMPIVFFYFIGTATSGMGGVSGAEGETDPLTLVAPADAGILVDELASRLEEQNFRVDRRSAGYPTADSARADGDPDGVAPGDNERRLVVSAPADAGPAPGQSLSDWALEGHRSIDLAYYSDAEGPDSAFDRLRIARAVYTVFADAIALRSSGEPLDPASFAGLAQAPRAISIDVRPAGRRELPPTGYSQTVPGIMVMFTMLIALTAGTIHLVLERNQGLLRRLASAPMSRASIIAGKIGGRVGVAVVQLGFAMLAGTMIFKVDWGPSLPMVVAVLFCWALFNAALAVLFGNLVRSEAQASGIGVMLAMALGALGGSWWPIEITPDWMQKLAHFLPTGWTMDAMHKLINFAYPPSAALPHVIAILAGSAVLAWLATRTFRYG